MSTKAEKLNAMLAGDAEATPKGNVETAAAEVTAPAPAKSEKKSTAVDPDATGEPAEVFIDSQLQTIEPGNQVTVRIGNKTASGVITGLKRIKDDQFAYILLEGKTASKMYHTGDITFVAKGTPPPVEVKKPTIIKKGAATVYSAPADDSPEENPLAKVKKARKNAAAEKPAKEKKDRTSQDVPAAGTKSAQVYDLLMAGKTRKEVATELGIVYQFVRSIDIRYVHKEAPVAAEATATEEPVAE